MKKGMKLITSAVAALTAAVIAGTICASAASLGDVNGDGKINVTDIILVAAHIKGKRVLSKTATAAADVNGDGKISDDDRTFIGNGTPDWTWGVNFSASWRNFDFYMLWQGTVGNDIFDATRRTDISETNLPAYMLNRWTGEGTSNKYPRFVRGDSVNWQSSDLYIQDGTYGRLKNIQLGYTLPERLTRTVFVSSLRLYVSAENLLTMTSYRGYDPEISSGGTSLGVDYGVYPQARTFLFGINLKF